MKRVSLQMFLLVTLFLLGSANLGLAQVEVMPWGNTNGIRLNGQLVPFETSLRIQTQPNGPMVQSKHYGLDPSFKNQNGKYLCNTQLEGIAFNQMVENMGEGKASIAWELKAIEAKNIQGIYFCIEIPEKYFNNGELSLTGQKGESFRFDNTFKEFNHEKEVGSNGFSIHHPINQLKVLLSESANVFITKGPSQTNADNTQPFYHVYFKVWSGNLKKGATKQIKISLDASTVLDTLAAEVKIEAFKPGRVFDGIGGNFRLQYPETDPMVIKYCLDSLNVTWGRIGMWWSDWHPNETDNPFELGKLKQQKPIVFEQMAMAQDLVQRGIPVIVSAWFPPTWARLDVKPGPGTYGYHLNPVKWKAIVASITDYLLFLKTYYGVEASLFSFNEPEIGVQVVQTPYEHVAFIKMLGQSFAANGLKTKLILAETSNGTPYALEFVKAGYADQTARNYIGAFGFHTWGGMENENLTEWNKYAGLLQLPLMVTESGPDSEAHRNPDLFLEPWYQHAEIDLYVRLCRVCQPLNIMQWQLTTDYSVLTGNGVYGTTGPLKTTQRYWNLKQLGITPQGSFHLPVVSNHPAINASAFGHVASGIFTIHLVNNGATRTIKLSGLPSSVKELQPYLTNANKGMELGQSVKVVNGEAEVAIEAQSFVTLVGK